MLINLREKKGNCFARNYIKSALQHMVSRARVFQKSIFTKVVTTTITCEHNIFF